MKVASCPHLSERHQKRLIRALRSLFSPDVIEYDEQRINVLLVRSKGLCLGQGGSWYYIV